MAEQKKLTVTAGPRKSKRAIHLIQTIERTLREPVEITGTGEGSRTPASAG